MLAVVKVSQVVVMVHPRYARRAVFTVLASGEVRYTLYNEAGRRQDVLTKDEARSRYRWLRKLGYLRWEEVPGR